MGDNIRIRFEAGVTDVNGQAIMRLPREQSQLLPSRGQVAVEGTLNGHRFATVLEPDGYRGHFVKLAGDLQKASGARTGSTATLELTVAREWPEPVVPDDFAAALADAPAKVREKWADITPMARWEWVRWVNSTASAATRAIRIEKSVSKLNGAHRRPCCVDTSACSDPALARSGKLIGAAPSGDPGKPPTRA